jgi:predicted unusual protein kinase regulating ubiquinone biosynthesis (AarF/ABC1/UbiB family)
MPCCFQHRLFLQHNNTQHYCLWYAAVQVYYARVRATGQPVAVKVQRPGALSTISKDLYVMRRGVGVYEQLVKRFTAQTTDYQQLLSTFAEGLYTEMDFRNEVGRIGMLRPSLVAGMLSA